MSGKLGVTLSLGAFKEIVKVKFITGKCTAMKNSTELNFQSRWQTYIKFISET